MTAEEEAALAVWGSSVTARRAVSPECPALKKECRWSRRLFWWRWVKTACSSFLERNGRIDIETQVQIKCRYYRDIWYCKMLATCGYGLRANKLDIYWYADCKETTEIQYFNVKYCQKRLLRFMQLLCKQKNVFKLISNRCKNLRILIKWGPLVVVESGSETTVERTRPHASGRGCDGK